MKKNINMIVNQEAETIIDNRKTSLLCIFNDGFFHCMLSAYINGPDVKCPDKDKDDDPCIPEECPLKNIALVSISLTGYHVKENEP